MLIKPLFANTNVDVPALSPHISTILQNKDYYVVMDLGGDNIGAKILSTYREFIDKRNVELLCVINTFRLTTSSVDGINGIIDEIESSAGYKVTGLINNTNLLQYTKKAHIEEGFELISKSAKKFNIPIVCTSVMNDSDIDIENIGSDILYMDKYIRTPVN
jgi:hypothetical protein